MKAGLWFLALVAVIAAGTWFVAWWTVPVIGAAWGHVKREDASAALAAGLAGMAAWGALLLVAASGAPQGSVMTSVGTALQVGPAALVALTVAFPGLLAAAAAGLMRSFAARHDN